MGVDHGGDRGGHVPPEFGEGGTIMQIVPRRFCHISIKTRNSSGDEIANVNFLYDDIVHAPVSYTHLTLPTNREV